MKKILVVDDEFLINYSLSATFQTSGTEVITAPDGETALKAISENHFDICFLDIHLPDINGLEIMKKLRYLSPGTKIVIMTGSEVSESMMKSIQENAHMLMAKPFDLDRIKEFVDRILTTGKPLYRDECTALKDHMSFIKWLADNNRKHERKPVSKCITCFSVSPQGGEKTSDMLSAHVIDISEAGMCIRTDYLLKPGHLIKLSDSPLECTGVVRWSMSVGSMESYRAGIQFVSDGSGCMGIVQ
jgi:CheY-like chemotaxis protein